ncbi:MAG: redox-regulated ATPase YchF [Candidatus Brocadiae bacterium]|nr:redox-regulated ATPase YchF [Candidatus Brocadiia bacterium]
MRIAIIGLPTSGKTTLFDALTGRKEEPGSYAAPGSVQVGVVHVDDGRLDVIAGVVKPKKVTKAALEFVDIGGLFSGEKPSPEAVEAMRGADGFLTVVRAFQSDAVPHRKGSVDAKRDLEEIDADLFIADLDIIERTIERLSASVKKPTPTQDEERTLLALLQRCREQLDTVGALDRLKLSANEDKAIRGFQFLTQKPALLLANIGEDHLGDETAAVAALGDRREPVLAVCAGMEKDLLELDPEERQPFLDDLGLEGLSDQKIVQAVLEAVDLITFFTAGDKETRAWLIPRGTTAVEAAGKVHTDIARGFIRAEVLLVDDLQQYGSWKDTRAHGKERLEGKDYVVQDGDIIHIRFSV